MMAEGYKMSGKWINIIDMLIKMLTIPAILIIGIIFLVYGSSRITLGVYLIALLLLLMVYVLVRKPIEDRIDARRKAKNMPRDIKNERRLRTTNYLTIMAVLAIGVCGWIFLREEFTLVTYLATLILIFVGLINVFQVIQDIS
jgi:hypothetical protein